MKSCKLIDILKIWIKNYGGNYKIIKGRKGDRQDEYLIGENELKYTKVLNRKKRIYYLIDYDKLSKKPLRFIVSSKNALKLNNSEILNLIKFGY